MNANGEFYVGGVGYEWDGYYFDSQAVPFVDGAWVSTASTMAINVWVAQE